MTLPRRCFIIVPSRASDNRGTKKAINSGFAAPFGDSKKLSSAEWSPVLCCSWNATLCGCSFAIAEVQTAFEDLHTVDGVVYDSFQQAAIQEASSLLQDDSEWDRTLGEAVSYQMLSKLRHLFAMILSSGMPQNPRHLCEKYAVHFCEDFHRQNREQYTAEESHLNQLLHGIEHYRALVEDDRFLRSTAPARDFTCFHGIPQLEE